MPIQTAIDSINQNQGSPFGFKNRIINGAMVIDQRNAGASVTPGDGQYVLDRTKSFQAVASKYSVQQNAGSVTPPSGFKNYLGVTSLSAYTVGSTEYFFQRQIIEGYNIADLGWGAAGASTVTLSFWVRSSLTGTFGGSLTNGGFDRSYPFTYTISSANTWTQISITIAGDTSGTWSTTNGSGITVNFGLGVGSTLSGTAGAWAGASYYSATGATSVVGTNGATFYITGVQLEKGTQATEFDYRPYGTELALCSRYYQPINSISALASSTTAIATNIQFAVPMRATPTISITTTLTIYDGVSNYTQSSADAGSYLGSAYGGLWYSITNFSGLTQYRSYVLNPNGKQDSIRATAEL